MKVSAIAAVQGSGFRFFRLVMQSLGRNFCCTMLYIVFTWRRFYLEVGSVELLLDRINFSVPIPAVHLFLCTETDFELLLALLNQYFCFVEFFQKLAYDLATHHRDWSAGKFCSA